MENSNISPLPYGVSSLVSPVPYENFAIFWSYHCVIPCYYVSILLKPSWNLTIFNGGDIIFFLEKSILRQDIHEIISRQSIIILFLFIQTSREVPKTAKFFSLASTVAGIFLCSGCYGKVHFNCLVDSHLFIVVNSYC